MLRNEDHNKVPLLSEPPMCGSPNLALAKSWPQPPVPPLQRQRPEVRGAQLRNKRFEALRFFVCFFAIRLAA